MRKECRVARKYTITETEARFGRTSQVWIPFRDDVGIAFGRPRWASDNRPRLLDSLDYRAGTCSIRSVTAPAPARPVPLPRQHHDLRSNVVGDFEPSHVDTGGKVGRVKPGAVTTGRVHTVDECRDTPAEQVVHDEANVS